MRIRWSIIALSVAIVFTYVLTIVLMIYIANHITIVDAQDYSGRTNFNQFLTLYTTIHLGVLLVLLIAVGLEDYTIGGTLSRLYYPLLALLSVLFGVFFLLSLYAADFLVSRSTAWTWLTDPEVRLMVVLFYALISVSFTWLITILLRLRGAAWVMIGTAALLSNTITLLLILLIVEVL